MPGICQRIFKSIEPVLFGVHGAELAEKAAKAIPGLPDDVFQHASLAALHIPNLPPPMANVSVLAIALYLLARRAMAAESQEEEGASVAAQFQTAAEQIQRSGKWDDLEPEWRQNPFLLLYAASAAQTDRLDHLVEESAQTTQRIEAILDRLGILTSDTSILRAGQKAIIARLDQLHRAQQPPIRPIDLRSGDGWNEPDRFQFERRITGMVGREEEEASLIAFLREPAAFKWWLWVAPAGSGKSRLALEFIIAAVADGWRAGFFDWRPNYSRWDLFDPDQKTLIVFDYARQDSAMIGRAIRQLTSLPAPRNPVRFLLLERSADAHEEWVKELLAEAGHRKFSTRHAPDRVLSPLDDRDFARVAYAVYAAHAKYVRFRIPMKNEDFETKLTALIASEVSAGSTIPSELRPLFAQFVGEAVAERDSFEDVRHWRLETIAHWWLVREALRWRFRGVTEEALNLLVLATVIGTVSDESRLRLASQPELQLPGSRRGVAWREFTGSGAGRPNGDGGTTFGGLEPDPLGEALVLERLSEPCAVTIDEVFPGPAAATRRLICVACREEPLRTALFMSRCVQDYPSHPNVPRLFEIAEECNPTYYPALVASAASQVVGTKVDPIVAIRVDRLDPAFRSMALVNRGVILGRRGRSEEEIAAYDAVLAMTDAPAEQRAKSLVNKGITHGELHQPGEAIAAFDLVLDMADAPSEQRAMALINKGVALGQLDRPKEAIGCFDLVSDMADAPSEQRAMALVNKGITLGQLDRPEEEIAAYDAVLAMTDAPAEQRAKALVNKGITHGELHQPGEAIAAFDLVLDMADAPAEQRAKALVNKGITLGQLDRPEEEIAAYDAVVAMTDAPAEQRAKALVNKGITHGELHQPGEAIAAFDLVLDMADAPAEQRAKALINKGVALGHLDQPGEAIAAFDLVLDMADAPAEQRAKALVNKGITLGRLGRSEEEIAAYDAVVAMTDAPADQRAKALTAKALAPLSLGDVVEARLTLSLAAATPDLSDEVRSLIERVKDMVDD